MTNVFSNNVDGANMYDTPANYPTWTVQSPQTGSDQSTVDGGTAPSPGSLVTPAAAQTAIAGGVGQTNAFTSPSGTAAKLTDLQALQTLVKDIVTALAASTITGYVAPASGDVTAGEATFTATAPASAKLADLQTVSCSR